MRILITLICFAMTASVAHADVILGPASFDWEYTFTDPTISQPSWNSTFGTGSGWSTGQAPFGNQTAADGTDPDFFYNTFWPADTFGDFADDLWVRHEVDLTGWDLSTIRWDLGVDNGFKLYANGNFVTSDNGEGYTFRWEYPDGMFGPMNSFLLPGVNVVAVALDDHGGRTAFDMQITGTPEPGSMILLGTGLLATASAVRRRRKAGQ